MAERRDEREHRTHRPKGLRLRCRLRIRSNRKICDQAGEHEQKADAEDRDYAVVERLERTREVRPLLLCAILHEQRFRCPSGCRPGCRADSEKARTWRRKHEGLRGDG